MGAEEEGGAWQVLRCTSSVFVDNKVALLICLTVAPDSLMGRESSQQVLDPERNR